MSESKAKIDALKGISKMMARLELDRVKGYRKKPEPELEVEKEEEDEDDLMQVLDAKAKPLGKTGLTGSRS